MALPSLRAWETTTEASSSNFTISKPFGTAEGDLLVLVLVNYSTKAGSFTVTPPAGWTARYNNAGAGSPAPYFRMIYTKTATASEPSSYTFSANSTWGGSRIALLAIQNGKWGSLAANYGATVDSTSPAASGASGLALSILGYTDTGGSNGTPNGQPPAGWSEIADHYQRSGAGYNAAWLGIAQRDVADGAIPSATWTHSSWTYLDESGFGAALLVQSLNEAPNAPTLTTMHDGGVIDRAATNRASHAFSDPDAGDSQSAFDHRYRLVGSATWTEALASTPNQYVDYPAGTFAAGDYERQVRTYDAQGVVGPWSSSGFFPAADAPATPTITDPIHNATIGLSSATVTWSAQSQDAYQLQVLDGGLVLEDSGVVVAPSARSRVVQFPDNNVTRSIRVRVRVNGLWSDWYTITVQVSYTPPTTPVVALTPTGAALVVQVTNPVPGTGEPTTTHNKVFVDDGLDDGETLRVLNLAPNGSWTYWTPRSGLDYEGRVRVVAVGDNGTEASSA